LVKAIKELDPDFNPKGWKIPGLEEKLEELKKTPVETPKADEGKDDAPDHSKACLIKAFGKNQDSKLCGKCLKSQEEVYLACEEAVKAAAEVKAGKTADPTTATVAKGRFKRYKGHVYIPKLNTFEEIQKWHELHPNVNMPFTIPIDRFFVTTGGTFKEVVAMIKELRDSEPEWADHKDFRTPGALNTYVKYRVNQGWRFEKNGDHYRAVGFIKKSGLVTDIAKAETEKKAA